MRLLVKLDFLSCSFKNFSWLWLLKLKIWKTQYWSLDNLSHYNPHHPVLCVDQNSAHEKVWKMQQFLRLHSWLQKLKNENFHLECSLYTDLNVYCFTCCLLLNFCPKLKSFALFLDFFNNDAAFAQLLFFIWFKSLVIWVISVWFCSFCSWINNEHIRFLKLNCKTR